jgi:hypothetical protein
MEEEKNLTSIVKKNIKTYLTAVGCFIGGYIAKSLLFPDNTIELQRRFEARLLKNPSHYEEVIDRAYEFSHKMKGNLYDDVLEGGAVPFKDMRLVHIHNPDESISAIVNLETEQVLPIYYVDDTMVVGTYSDRMTSLKDETIQKGISFGERVQNQGGEYMNQFRDYLNGLFDYPGINQIENGSRKENLFEIKGDRNE